MDYLASFREMLGEESQYPFGDVALAEKLERFERYLRTSHRHRPIVITGYTGSGKTTFAMFGLERFRPANTEVEWIRLNELSDGLEIPRGVFKIKEGKVRRRFFVVIDNAEQLEQRTLQMAVNRFFNLKAVENVIIINSAPDLQISGARKIYLGPPEGKLYGLRDQLLSPQRSIIPIVRPQIVTINEQLIQRLKKEPSDLFKISPRQFEEVVAELLTGMGMEVQLTQETRDGGKDILAYMETEIGKFLTLVETKQHNKRRPVGVGLVRSLFGTLVDHQATSGMLVTTSRFAKPAQEFQERHKYQLSLKDYGDVVSWLLKHKS